MRRRKPLDDADFGVLAAYDGVYRKRGMDHLIQKQHIGGKRTFYNRVRKLAGMGLLKMMNSHYSLTPAGTNVLINQPHYSTAVSDLALNPYEVSTHYIRFNYNVIRAPEDSELILKGWKEVEFVSKKDTYLHMRTNSGYLRLFDKKLVVFLPPIVDMDPTINIMLALKKAAEIVEWLKSERIVVGEPTFEQYPHHVLNVLKPVAEYIYRRLGSVERGNIVIDNSKSDGGEFEVHGKDGDAKADRLVRNLDFLCNVELGDLPLSKGNEKKEAAQVAEADQRKGE